MRKTLHSLFAVPVVLSVLVLAPSTAEAQVNCGSVYTKHEAGQFLSEPYYEMVAKTWRDIVTCPLELQTEAWVWGHGTAGVHRGVHASSVYKIVLVPLGWHESISKHWLIWTMTNHWEFFGIEGGEAEIRVRRSPEEQCYLNQGEWDPYMQVCTYPNSPVIVDMENDGYRLTSPASGVWFDMDGDGVKEKTAWTDPDGNEAFLVMDRNGNGTIDNGTELFGDSTPMYQEAGSPKVANGFDALLALERPEFGGGTPDRIIDARDGAFARLYLWRDANHDGISQADELTRVNQTAFAGFGTWYKEKKSEDQHRNQFRLRGTLYVRTDNGKLKERDVWDIWLRQQR